MNKWLCKDSKSYLEDLETWKKSCDDKNCILSTVDVVNLYPSLLIDLVTKALVEALELCSVFETPLIKYLVSVSEIALRNNFIVFQEKYFKQKKGIITGDNNSVVLANILLHHTMMKATKLNIALFIRRYIDDILLISESNTVSIEILESLKITFKKYDLDLTSTIMSAESGMDALPILDIEYIFTGANEIIFLNFVYFLFLL